MAKKSSDLMRDTDQMLQGIRIVLPGTQALIGFQFIAFFNPAFQSLDSELKALHFCALLLAITCSLLLIAPVAFQQLGEDGSPTNKFLRYTRKMLGLAMICLLFAIVGDVYLAARIIEIESVTALLISLGIFALGSFLWFVNPLFRRQSKQN